VSRGDVRASRSTLATPPLPRRRRDGEARLSDRARETDGSRQSIALAEVTGGRVGSNARQFIIIDCYHYPGISLGDNGGVPAGSHCSQSRRMKG